MRDAILDDGVARHFLLILSLIHALELVVIPLFEVLAGYFLVAFGDRAAGLRERDNALVLVVDSLVRVLLGAILLFVIDVAFTWHLVDLGAERLPDALELLDECRLVAGLQVLMCLPHVEGVLGRVSGHVVLLEAGFCAFFLGDFPEQFDEELAEVLKRNSLFAGAAVDLPSDQVGPFLAFQRHVEVLAQFEEVVLADLLRVVCHFVEGCFCGVVRRHVLLCVERKDLLESLLLLFGDGPCFLACYAELGLAK